MDRGPAWTSTVVHASTVDDGSRPSDSAEDPTAKDDLEAWRPTRPGQHPEAAVSLEGGELVIRVRLAAAPADELVAIAADALEPLGLELRAVQRLIAEGRLRTAQIGRRRFTRKSYLLALVDELPTSPHVSSEQAPPDVLTLAARKAARRVSARNPVRKKGAAA